MRVDLGKFARSNLESRADGDLVAGVQAALLHYTRRLSSSDRPVDFPRFRRDGQPPAGDSIEVPVGAATLAALEREAGRQEATVEQLAAHAVMVYLVDLEDASTGPGEAQTPLSTVS
jgi:hypothetical protein